jgi:uncharacterized protein GlcG (DUF336 family)
MKLEIAQKMVTAALAAARTRNLKPLAVAVLDARGALKAFAAEDGTSLKRAEIATGKAAGALPWGWARARWARWRPIARTSWRQSRTPSAAC